MHDPGLRATASQFRRDLKLASWICENDVVRAGLKNVVGLTAGQYASHLRLGQIVGSRRAAAEIGLSHLDYRHAGNRREQFSGRLANSESMREMTRVVIGHGASELTPSLRRGRDEQ